MAVALAVAMRLQQQPITDAGDAKTYCYKAVRTHDKNQATASCFSVQNGVFNRVWAESDDSESVVSQDKTIDGYVIPGLWDGHGHLMAYGEFLHSVDLFGAKSLSEAKDRIKAYLKKNPEAGTKDQWVRGVGWDQDVYGRMPTAVSPSSQTTRAKANQQIQADIEEDPALKGIYMMLDRIDVHCTWVSQSVLDLLPADLPDIPGGEIIRDPGMGVFCDNAMDYVVKRWPKPDSKKKALAVKSALAKLNEVGLVGMHDASSLPEDIKVYTDMSKTEDWTLRVYSMLECSKRNTFCPSESVKIDNVDSMFTVRAVKLFAGNTPLFPQTPEH